MQKIEDFPLPPFPLPSPLPAEKICMVRSFYRSMPADAILAKCKWGLDFKRPVVTLSRRNDPVCSGWTMKDANYSVIVVVLIIEMSLDQSYLTY